MFKSNAVVDDDDEVEVQAGVTPIKTTAPSGMLSPSASENDINDEVKSESEEDLSVNELAAKKRDVGKVDGLDEGVEDAKRIKTDE
jgi:hypothetical protein